MSAKKPIISLIFYTFGTWFSGFYVQISHILLVISVLASE